MLPADDHVHSEWSYDTGPRASMVQACERAIQRGIGSIAFTEHLDFSDWGPGDQIADEVDVLKYRPRIRPLDVQGYLECVADCRQRFGELRILSGVELGEPHLFAGSIDAALSSGDFDRVLGSLHAFVRDGRIAGISEMYTVLPAHEVVRLYFTEMLRLISGSSVFQVLAHVDFPRRYWPEFSAGIFREQDFEEEYRTVFAALASSGRALEINTRSPLASAELMRWWYEAGGEAVSFGSDAHEPFRVGEDFELAVDVVQSAGFRPGRSRNDFWRR